MAEQHLQIITTGGTIDKTYFDAKSEYQIGEPSIVSILQEMNVAFEYSVESVFREDSLDITDAHRGELLQAVEACSSSRVVITHGTDTMVDTAKTLVDHARATGKTIVLTGALSPAIFKHTDAIFNIGSAVSAVQILDAGVYIAMNGTIFNCDNVVKNREKGRFETLN